MNAAVYSCFNISLFFRLHRSMIMLINCKFLIAYLLVFYFKIYFSQPFNASCAQISAVQQSIFPFRIALDHTCGWWTLITRSNNTQAKPITAQRKWITIKTHTRTYTFDLHILSIIVVVGRCKGDPTIGRRDRVLAQFICVWCCVCAFSFARTHSLSVCRIFIDQKGYVHIYGWGASIKLNARTRREGHPIHCLHWDISILRCD